MELLHHGFHEKELQPPIPASPNSSSNSSSSSSSSSSNGGVARAAAASALASPLSPKPTPRSIDANPHPTTFIQADTSSFKQVVQMLTGSAETAAKRAVAAPKSPIPPAAKATGPKKPSFKLYERRSSLKNLKMISPLIPAFVGSNPNSPAGAAAAAFSPRRQPEILSPSVLDLPSLTLSPVTPLIPDPFNRSGAAAAAAAGTSAEDQAIAEKGFYLHPSPRTTPRDGQPPRLLPLFPVTSPRAPSAPAAGAST